MLLPDVTFPRFRCTMIRHLSILLVFLLTTFLLSHAQLDSHPYAFERPMSNRNSHLPHKLGVPFVERKIDSVENRKVVEIDSEEFHVDNNERSPAPERDRSSSPGEIEIRSKILRNLTNFAERKKIKNNAEAKSPVEMSPLDLSQNSTTADDDLTTSQNVPVPLSLKGNKEMYYRLKNYKSENSKPNKPKPKTRKTIVEYADDDEYYYVYDDDEYYDDLPPKKTSNGRKNVEAKSRNPQTYYSTSPSRDPPR